MSQSLAAFGHIQQLSSVVTRENANIHDPPISNEWTTLLDTNPP